MKVAMPIALVAMGAVILALLMTPNRWQEPPPGEWKSDRDRIAQAKQQLFDKDPVLKAEDADLASKHEQAETAFKSAAQAKYEANAALINHNLKVQDELVKIDPTLKAPFDRVAFDNKVPGGSGDPELYAEYGQEYQWPDLILTSLIFIFPAGTLALGILLQFRLPSWAGAHLFLAFLILPLIFFGPIMLHFAINVYLMRFAEFRMEPSPYMFQEAHHILVLNYLSYIPSLLLYVVLLFRIHLREQKAKRVTEAP